MIKLSIDRLAQIYAYELPSGVESSEYSQLVVSLWSDKIRDFILKHIPNNLTLKTSGNAYSTQFSYDEIGQISEPIMNVSAQQYVDSIRVDFNPRRVRHNIWLQYVMDDIKNFAKNGKYHYHNSQVDLSIDMIDEKPLSNTFTLSKSGVKRTSIFHAVNGDLQTQYYGVRGSSSYVRIYNKHDEQVSNLSRKYRILKSKALNKYERLIEKSSKLSGFQINSDNIIDTFEDYALDSGPFGDRDLTNKDDFKAALEWALGRLREQEENFIPIDWTRFEIVLRTKKLSDDRLTFDDDSVYDYINSISNTELSTISDYSLRALALAIESGNVQVSELSQNERARYRKILKYDEIVIFRTLSGNTQRIMGIDDFNKNIDPSQVVSEKHITKQSNNSLRDKVKKAFELSKHDLKAELMSYTF